MVMKRVVAYFIDIVLITFASSMLASISYLNPQLDNYNKVYDEYLKFYDDYKSEVSNIKTEEVLKKYTNQLNDINYRLDRNNLYGATYSIILTIIYFVAFQKYNGGQTLGKKIMKIKVFDNLSLFKYLIRTLILHNVFINALKVALLLIISKENYILINSVLYILALLIETTIIIMVSMRSDNRGLHDIIVGSKVVSIPQYLKEV